MFNYCRSKIQVLETSQDSQRPRVETCEVSVNTDPEPMRDGVQLIKELPDVHRGGMIEQQRVQMTAATLHQAVPDTPADQNQMELLIKVQDENSSLQRQIEKLQQEIGNLNSHKLLNEERLQNILDENELLRKQVHENQASSDTKDLLTRVNDENVQLRKQLLELQNVVKSNESIKKVSEENQLLRNQLIEMQRNLENNEVVQKLEDENKNLQKQISELQNSDVSKALGAENLVLKKQLSEVQNSSVPKSFAEKIQEENALLKQQLINSQESKANNEILNRLNEENLLLQKQMAELKSVHDIEGNKTREENQLLRSKVQELETVKVANERLLGNQATAIQTNKETQDKNVTKMRQEIELLRQELSELQGSKNKDDVIHKVTEENVLLRKQLNSLQGNTGNIVHSQRKIDTNIPDDNKLVEQLELQKSQIEAKCKTLEDDLALLRQSSMTTIEDLTSQRNTLEQSNLSLQENCNELNKKLDTERQDKATVEQTLAETKLRIYEMEQRVEAVMKEGQGQLDMNQVAEQKVAMATEENKLLKSQLIDLQKFTQEELNKERHKVIIC